MGHRCNMYFWRTTSQQEIDYIEESDGQMSVFEMKWNPKKSNTKLPESFLNAYNIRETSVITPDNYLDWFSIYCVFNVFSSLHKQHAYLVHAKRHYPGE